MGLSRSDGMSSPRFCNKETGFYLVASWITSSGGSQLPCCKVIQVERLAKWGTEAFCPHLCEGATLEAAPAAPVEPSDDQSSS